jgi:hypothetical protein
MTGIPTDDAAPGSGASAARAQVRWALVALLFCPLLSRGAETNGALCVGDAAFAPLQEARDGSYDYRLKLQPAEGKTQFDKVDFLFAHRDDASYCRFTWDDKGWRLVQKLEGETPRETGHTEGLPASLRDGGTLVVKSRLYRIEITADGRRVLRMPAQGSGAGNAGIATGDRYPVAASARCQRVAPILFGEDFGRAQDETEDFGVWEPLYGDWRLHSVIEDIQSNDTLRRRLKEGSEDRNANAFSLSGRSSASNDTDEALIITGYPFWDDYEVAVSARTSGGAIGLAFAVEDEANLWFVRWRILARGVAPARLELVKRVAGKDKIVATATVPARTDNWYRLSLAAAGSVARVSVDGRVVVSARDRELTGGCIGLMAWDDGPASFDDVDVHSIAAVRPDLAEPASAFDEEAGGQWTQSGDLGDCTFAGRSHVPGEAARRLFGSRRWSPASLEARLDLTPSTAEAGLLFAETGPQNSWALDWRAGAGGELVLSRTAGPVTQEVARVRCLLRMPASHHLRVDLGEEGIVRGYVNGELELRAVVTNDLSGRVGLLAVSPDDVRFGDVRMNHVTSRDWERPVKVGVFADDPYMQGWASPRHAWIPVENGVTNATRLYRHKGDFYGAFSVRGPLSDGLSFVFGRDSVSLGHGYEVRFAFDGGVSNRTAAATLTRDGAVLKETRFEPGERRVIEGEQVVDEKLGPMPLPAETVSHGIWGVHREGRYIWVEACGRELFSHREQAPLTGRELGLAVREPLDFACVEVKRDRVKDYQFERATADWQTVGKWEVTNRFSCDPRWSHMNGRSRGVAALWNKLAFEGDYTLEYYAGMRMRQGDMLDVSSVYYPRVGDINVALCADGSSLFSGYNVIIAAWDKWWSERWTQFRRRGDVVAKIDREFVPRTRDKKPVTRPIEGEWDPGGRPVHGAWYFVKVRKTGGRFDVWFDNTPVFSYEDSEPLPGNRLALWTQDNSIVVARARIAYRSKPLPPAVPRPGKVAGGDKAPAEDSRESVAIACPSHPGRHFDFERGLQGWQSAEDDQGAEATRVPGGPKGSKHALRLTNTHGGGDFRSVVPLPPLDLGRVAHLAFDCAVPPGARVNLYLKIKGRPHDRYFVALSGPDAASGNCVRLGRFEGFKADGKWRRLSFDLAGALRREQSLPRKLVLEEMAFAYLHGGYLNAGLGGNPAGASYEIDNLTVASIGPSEAQLTRPAETELSYNVLPHPGPADKALHPWQGVTNTVALPGPGLWFINVFEGAQGGRSRVASIPVRTDRPLTVVSTSPEAGKAWGGSPVEMRFATNTSASPVVADLSLVVNEVPVPKALLAESLDREKRVLRVDMNCLDGAYTNGETVNFALTYGDTIGGAPTNVRWSSRFDLSADRMLPGPVRLDDPAVAFLDFEDGRGRAAPASSSSRSPSYSRSRSGPRVELSPRGEGENGHALSVFNRLCGSGFDAWLAVPDFNAGRTPVLEFDYCVIPEARVDLVAKTTSEGYVIGINDLSSDEEKKGVIPGVAADGSWRHAKLNLADMIAAGLESVSAPAYNIRSLGFADCDHRASPPGAWYAIDNVRTTPVVSSREGTRLRWHACDAGGIAGYSYLWSSNAVEAVDTTLDVSEGSAVFTNLPDGEMFFHVRACDRAGNWGPTTHQCVLVDNASVAVPRVDPPRGSRAAADRVAVAFGDSLAQLDLEDTRLTVNGRTCSLKPPYSTLDVARRELTWNWVLARRQMCEPIPDGQPMAVQLSGVRDFAGNATPPLEWEWKIDYARDTNGPTRPELTCWSQRTIRFDDFSDGPGSWRPYSGDGKGRTAVETVVDADTGSECLQVTKASWGLRFGAYAYRGTLDTNEYDLITFDYKLEKGVAMDLLVYVNSAWRAVLLTGEESVPVLGRVDNIIADGRWHHARIDLPGMLREAIPDGSAKDLQVRYLLFGNWQLLGNPVGTSFHIDNFAILKSGSPLPEVHCTALDATGIRGFRYTMDRSPWSVPEQGEASSAPRLALPAIDEAGLWYVHVRAQDGAGNWGATRHYPYYCPTAIAADGTEGLETSARWGLEKVDKRTVCVLRKSRSATGANGVLALGVRTWQADTIRLRREGAKQAAAAPRFAADFFNQGRTSLKVAAYVCLDPKADAIVGEPVELPPGKWIRGAGLGVDLPGEGARACHEQGLLLYAPHRARSNVVIDRIVEQGT